MTNRTNQVPEPDKQPKEENEPSSEVEPPAWSSEDDSPDEELDAENLHGYQPLTLAENDGGISEFYSETLTSSDEEDEEAQGASGEEHKRELSFNPDLVLSTMQGITIPGNSIPPWAKEMSDKEWKEVVERTIKGEEGDITATESAEKS